MKELGEIIPDSFADHLAASEIKKTIDSYEKSGDEWLKGEKSDKIKLHTTLQFYNALVLAAFSCESYGMVVYLTCQAVRLELRKGFCEHTALSLIHLVALASVDNNNAVPC